MFTQLGSDEKNLLEKVSATAIANQSILKCSLAGHPLTVDNVIQFVGDFIDPEDVRTHGIIERIETAIGEVLACQQKPAHRRDGH